MPASPLLSLAEVAVKFERVQLAGGWKGTNQTVRRMERLVEDSLTDPVVRLAAEAIVRHTPERDKMSEHKAISNFVRQKMKYRNEAVETIKTPRVMLDEIKRYGFAQEDCDGFCVLWGALHRVMGHDIRFRVASQRRDKVANHIFGQVNIPGRGWVTDDCIKKDRPMGWQMPEASVTESRLYAVGNAFAGLAGVEDDGEGATLSGSCCRSIAPPPGLGQLEIIGALVGAAASAASLAVQMQQQKKALAVQKKAMDESKRQFDEQVKMAKEQSEAEERLAQAQIQAGTVRSSLGISSLPSWAFPAGLVAAAGIAAYLILKGK